MDKSALSFWKNKRVFLTGHTGFKGSWLSLWLKHLGSNLCGYSLNPPTEPSLFALAKVYQNIKSIEGDVRDLKTLRESIERFEPEIVIHMAGQSIVSTSYADPLTTYSTNVMGTVNILEAIRFSHGVKACLIVTSDKCYENQNNSSLHKESDALGASDPYSTSKACAELVTSSYRHSFSGDIKIASARSGNVIGGGDFSKDRLVPDIISALSNGRDVQIRHPHSIRPWQHVLEPLKGYLLLCQKLYSKTEGDFAQPWNFGPSPENSISVSKIADEIISRWGSGKWTYDETSKKYHESTSLALDSSKAREKLGWQPKLSIVTAFDGVVEWHKAALKGEKMDAFTLKQIEGYISL